MVEYGVKYLSVSGTHSGIVQIVNASSGQIEKEYSLHSSPVRYIVHI